VTSHSGEGQTASRPAAGRSGAAATGGRLRGRTALITGAAGGIGRATAIRFAQEGADVVAVDLPGTALSETAAAVEALGRRALAIEADVTDQASLDDAVAQAEAELGGFDTVFANAGILAVPGSLAEDDWQRVLDVNLTGVWRTVKAAAGVLRRAPRDRSIIVTASTVGVRPRGGDAYGVSKFAVVGLVSGWAQDFGADAIRVNVVAPVAVDTDMVFSPELRSDPARMEERRTSALRGRLLNVPWVDPIDVANAVLFLASDEARYITGVVLPVDGGTLAKHPANVN
jgi:(+)-trans-carveol dehydrogenase